MNMKTTRMTRLQHSLGFLLCLGHLEIVPLLSDCHNNFVPMSSNSMKKIKRCPLPIGSLLILLECHCTWEPSLYVGTLGDQGWYLHD